MRRIFVSCGQETEEEITLGKEIIKVIDANNDMTGLFCPERS